MPGLYRCCEKKIGQFDEPIKICSACWKRVERRFELFEKVCDLFWDEMPSDLQEEIAKASKRDGEVVGEKL